MTFTIPVWLCIFYKILIVVVLVVSAYFLLIFLIMGFLVSVTWRRK